MLSLFHRWRLGSPVRAIVHLAEIGHGSEWRWCLTATYATGAERSWSFPPRQVISADRAIAIAKYWWQACR